MKSSENNGSNKKMDVAEFQIHFCKMNFEAFRKLISAVGRTKRMNVETKSCTSAKRDCSKRLSRSQEKYFSP